MNNKLKLNSFAKIFLVFFIYLLLQLVYKGVISKPYEIDSLSYHLPIAKSILSGSFIKPDYNFNHQYFPGASEMILALFIFLRIPLNLYNVVSIITLFFIVWHSSTIFKVPKAYGIIMAVSIATLNVVVRWANVQTVDIWLLVFYLLSLFLLIRPKNSVWYYLALGVSIGMLFGTKYSGPLYALVLIIFFFKNFIKHLNLPKLVIFSVPFSALGLFWYVRNYIAINNPFYPWDSFLFAGIKGNPIIDIQIWKAIIDYPVSMASAFFSELMIWSIAAIVIPVWWLFFVRNQNTHNFSVIKKLFFLGFTNFFIFLILPSGSSYQLHCSNFRLSLPVFAPLIIGSFVLAYKYGKSEVLSLISFANILMLPSIGYHPKFLFILIPLLLFCLNSRNDFFKLN